MASFSITFLRQLKRLSAAVILMTTFTINAQNTVDSVDQSVKDTINSLLDKAWKLGRINPKKSLEILSEIDAINATMVHKFKEDVVWYYYGVFYKNNNQFDKSEEGFNKYQEYHEQKDNKWQVASVNMAKANLFYNLGNYEKSSEAATLVLKIYETVLENGGMY